MSELTPDERAGLIEQMGLVSARLDGAIDRPQRDELMVELRRLTRLLWLDGKSEP